MPNRRGIYRAADGRGAWTYRANGRKVKASALRKRGIAAPKRRRRKRS